VVLGIKVRKFHESHLVIQIYGVPLKMMRKNFSLVGTSKEKGTEKEGAEFMRRSVLK
jgi:hypothetical protein